MAEEAKEAVEGTKTVSAEEARVLREEGARLLDVRADHEWEAGHIEGATHIALPELASRAGELGAEEKIVVYCRGGDRQLMAAAALDAAGYDVAVLEGGITGWEEEGRDLEPAGGYVADPGEAAAVLEQRKRGG